MCGLSSWTSVAILRSCFAWCSMGACRGCPLWPTETILPSPAVTRRPPGAKFLYRDVRFLPPITSLTVSLAILIVASRQIPEILPDKCSLTGRGLSSPAQIQRARGVLALPVGHATCGAAMARRRASARQRRHLHHQLPASTECIRRPRASGGPGHPASPGIRLTGPRTQYPWYRSRFDEEPGRDEKSRHRDQRVRDTP